MTSQKLLPCQVRVLTTKLVNCVALTFLLLWTVWDTTRDFKWILKLFQTTTLYFRVSIFNLYIWTFREEAIEAISRKHKAFRIKNYFMLSS